MKNMRRLLPSLLSSLSFASSLSTVSFASLVIINNSVIHVIVVAVVVATMSSINK